MFHVTADSLKAYFNFDSERKVDLEKLDTLIHKAAPGLKRYFHEGTPSGEPGMRMKMIGYGEFRYVVQSGQSVSWPAIGMALQKNYISVYLSVTKDGMPLLHWYTGKLGELRAGRNNFSFVRFDDLNAHALSALFAEAAKVFNEDADNPASYKQSSQRHQ